MGVFSTGRSWEATMSGSWKHSSKLAVRSSTARDGVWTERRARSRAAAHKARQIMGGHGRSRAVVALDLDQAGLGAAALAQLAGADIEGERVGIAVLLQRPVGARVSRIEPGAGAEPDHARADAVAQARRGEAGAAVVEDAHQVALGEAAPGGVLG